MLQSTMDNLLDELFFYLTGKRKSAKSLLIKPHSENLELQGDISFPAPLKSWHDILDNDEYNRDTCVLHILNKKPEDLINDSKHFPIPIRDVKESKNRFCLFLHRPLAIKTGISEAVANNIVLLQRISHSNPQITQCDPLCTEDNLTTLRIKFLAVAIENLSQIIDKKLQMFVTCKSSSVCPKDMKLVMCGTVVNAKTGMKETVIKSEEYIRARQTEMSLIAQHKYGVRVLADPKWKAFVEHLGESAVVFDLLQVKPSSPCKVNFDCAAAGSSKGASFVLYNCARLETIIKTYNDKVCEGIYPPLPPLESIDFSLLSDEDEWTLVYNYVLSLPGLLRSCAADARPHGVCAYLSALARTVSQYYRKVRVLMEPRQHLLPVIFARMHLLKTLNDIIKICLKILNIKSVSQM